MHEVSISTCNGQDCCCMVMELVHMQQQIMRPENQLTAELPQMRVTK